MEATGDRAFLERHEDQSPDYSKKTQEGVPRNLPSRGYDKPHVGHFFELGPVMVFCACHFSSDNRVLAEGEAENTENR